jgi:antitoxin (DNA-binding transcriptional repressor) of toxin-antitoxin stability system
MSELDENAERAVELDQFEPQCLELINEVESGSLRRVVLTRSGQPIAALVPVTGGVPSLRGVLRHMMRPVPGIDITEPTGEVWDAERA